jgi:HlyD family secretion protein
MTGRLLCLITLTVSLGACEEQVLQAVGQLESDRVELVAESSEPIVEILVTEGDRLAAGQLLLSQDSSRLEIRRREGQATIDRLQALLDEQRNGPRPQTIAAMAASLQEAEAEQAYRQQELDRLQGLVSRNLTSRESVDLAAMQLQTARARIERIQAQLDELQAGTRTEQIAQTEAQLAQARAQLESTEFDLERLQIQSPVAGRVDSLPFEVGERPRVGDVVAVLLTGAQAHARVYIPEPLRAGLQPGDELQVHVDGLDAPLPGSIRRIAAEASFTPYFALTERDRSRLAYVAEVTLPETEPRLPEGLPVHILFDRDED